MVAQDDDLWLGASPLEARALRRSLIRQSRVLHLRSPFSWRDYLGALLNSAAPPDAQHGVGAYAVNLVDDGEQSLRVVPMVFGPGESARWVVQRQSDPARVETQHNRTHRLFESGVRYTLLLSDLADDEYLEHIVYHELGHLERGHLSQALAIGSEALLCASADELGEVNGALNASLRWEQEAELFALTLTRLARGWDPALAPSTISHFFDFLM
ncbi:MAG: hypothetical protein ACRDID_20855 [Ktedonobacterales bacterium]